MPRRIPRSLLALALLSCAPAAAPPASAPAQAPAGPPPAASAPAAARGGAIVPEVPPVVAPPAGPVDARVARLASLGRVWGEVRYLHPYLYERTIDWDAALLRAIPRIADAKTGAEEDAALEEMLKTLGDPLTYLERPAPTEDEGAAPAAELPASARIRWEGKGKDVLVLDVGGNLGMDAIVSLPGLLPAEIPKAKALIVDLRPPPGQWSAPPLVDRILSTIGRLLPSRDTVGPRERWVEHHGYAPQRGVTSGGYVANLVTSLPEAFPAAKGPRPARIVFLTSMSAGVPALAVALQRTGDAQILAAGPLNEEAVVEQATVPRGDRPAVVYRMTVLEEPLRADVELPEAQAKRPRDAGAKDALLEKALALVAAPAPARRALPAKPAAAAPQPVGWQHDAVYADQPYPSRELRLLSLFRLWNVIQLFYPNIHLMGDTWDKALIEFIPRFEAAADAKAYALAISELAARIPDGHVFVSGGAASEVFGMAITPIVVQRIEGRPIVTELLRPAAKEAGLSIGDVIISVDGEEFEARAKRLGKYAAASNPWFHALRASQYALRGAEGSTATLVVEGEGGRRKEVKLARQPFAALEGPPGGEAYRMLDGGIGYVDLTRLQVPQVGAMFQALQKAKGIVFDMRGYPNRTVWDIGPRLNVRDAPYGAMFLRRLLVRSSRNQSIQGLQPFLPAEGPKFGGPTVMLVDERTISQAEHTGMHFQAANGTRFVGGPTAGANGDITNTCLPGGICVSFSGAEVRHADGRPLQRVGLSPLTLARPTIAGLRAGKDEVLARGLEVLREELASRSHP